MVEDIFFAMDYHEAGAEAFRILDSEGPYGAVQYLAQWHYPGEHDTRTVSGAGSSDCSVTVGDYILSWNARLGYIGLEAVVR